MSEISGGKKTFARIEYSVPLSADYTNGTGWTSWAGNRNIHDLLFHMEEEAKKYGIATNFDDWFHVTAFEDDRLVFWFEVPDSQEWVND